MTDTEINYLARVYAESANPEESYGGDIVERNMDVRIECDAAIPVLQWLSERYCIVDKSIIKAMWEQITNVYLAHSHISYDGARYVFAELFGKDTIPELFKDKEE